MPRQSRIDIPGLLQHVIVRGVARSDIFWGDEDREDFVQRLSLLLAETHTHCYAWTLLDNHVHLLLMPTEQSLALFMRRLLTGYAVAFNLRHKRAGHLFQNRYKSIVCDDEAYLLELVRYIHLNPVRAGAVDDLSDLANYLWCGHRQLVGESTLQLIKADVIMPLFAKRKKAAFVRYLQFLSEGLQLKKGIKLSSGGRRVSQAYNGLLLDNDLYDDRVLGGGDFVEQVLGAAQTDVDATMTLNQLVTKLADYCNIAAEELLWSCKLPANVRAKALICFLATRHHRIAGVDVAKRLGYSTSAVSRAALRGMKLFKEDRVLQGFLKNVDL